MSSRWISQIGGGTSQSLCDGGAFSRAGGTDEGWFVRGEVEGAVCKDEDGLRWSAGLVGECDVRKGT
jgi:hypothetical protein